MRILVVGSGGREHALAYRLSHHHEVICAPGNPGIARDVETAPISVSDTTGLVELANSRAIDLVVVGPEDPLIAGLADQMRAAGIVTFGPSAGAARLEGSKAHSKRLMAEAAVPTAEFEAFSDFQLACEFARRMYGNGVDLAVKASGAALGRGVAVCDSLEAALNAIEDSMVRKHFGASGETVVLEERMHGREFSLLTVVGEHNFVSLPIAQDYKRALDGDLGPNTGGMGSFSPCGWASQSLIDEVETRMVEPILTKLRQEGTPFTGTLFTGVMVTESGPKCLEYNVRFGDPETQTVMMRLEGDFGQNLLESATGQEVSPFEVSSQAAVTVIVASGGYPGVYKKNQPVTIDETPAEAKLFFAGVSELDGVLVNSGGRVVGASAKGSTVEAARSLAYRAASAVKFHGAYVRSDIATG